MKQTIFRVFMVGGSVTITGTVTIAFPTALLPQTQSTVGTVVVGAGASVAVLAANPNRTFAQIVNLTGNTLRLRFGGAAGPADLEIPTGGAYRLEPNTIGQINQQSVNLFNPTAGALNVTVEEW